MFDKKAKKHQEEHIQKLLSRTSPETIKFANNKLKPINSLKLKL